MKPREWIIKNNDLYWRPEGKGYTRHLHEAGLFTEEYAKIQEGCNRISPDKAHHITEHRESIREDMRFARRMLEALKRAEKRREK